jgi:hypothetical protein
VYILQEHLLSIDNFGKPRILKDQHAAYTLIVRLLLLNPGEIQSHPEMGIGIVRRYLYADTISIDTLKQEVSDQLSKYLPELVATEVIITEEERTLIIIISANGTTYKVNFNKDTYALQDL